jgi:hypothetical protein
MFKVNTDLSIEITRGDAVEFIVTAQENGENYVFKSGDIVRFKVFEKKGCDCVVLQKDFGVESDTEEVTIVLEEADTKIGELIHKPKDYWYEVELNPDTLPYTIIGYDADGAKVFKLYPEGRDFGADPITPEDIPFVDKELDMTSHNPVENQTIVKEFGKVNDRIQQNADAVALELANKLSTSGGTMVGNLSMGSKKLTGLTDPENDSDAVSLGYAKREYVPKSHLENNENPHNVTAEQVGARPNTWMPTANDVGARSNTWMPTASDVGARPDDWMPTAREVGARPSTWTPTASEVGARPDTWTPTAAQVGARPNTWTPTANDVGAVPTTRKVNGKALSADITLSASDVGALSLAGGTMTGSINMGTNNITYLADPTGPMQAANKRYVDNSVSTSVSSASNDYHTAHFAKIGKLVICTLLPKVAGTTAIYQEDITMPTGYYPATTTTFTIYTTLDGGGNAEVRAYASGILRVLRGKGVSVAESSKTYCWVTA